MYKFSFSIESLLRSTLQNDEEREYVQYWTIENFRQAILDLNQAGLSSDQIQILQGMPFSRFSDREFSEVLLLALAIRKNSITVKKIHLYLQERELWARMHKYSICIQTETLPEVGTINSYLGLVVSSS
jgi:hypothetical protein